MSCYTEGLQLSAKQMKMNYFKVKMTDMSN